MCSDRIGLGSPLLVMLSVSDFVDITESFEGSSSSLVSRNFMKYLRFFLILCEFIHGFF